jgi:hypothetical protein
LSSSVALSPGSLWTFPLRLAPPAGGGESRAEGGEARGGGGRNRDLNHAYSCWDGSSMTDVNSCVMNAENTKGKQMGDQVTILFELKLFLAIFLEVFLRFLCYVFGDKA